MAGDVFTASGTKFYIGPSMATLPTTQAQYEAIPEGSWIEVGLVETVGEYGDSSAPSTFAALGDGRQRKGKGARDAGDLALTVGHDAEDAGQSALVDAEGTTVNYPFRVILPNPLDAEGEGETHYFRGLVMSKRFNIGGNDNVVRRTFQIAVNSEVIEVKPTAGTS